MQPVVGACEQNIYVKKSKLDTYKGVWTDYASALDYKIAGDGAKDFKVATNMARLPVSLM